MTAEYRISYETLVQKIDHVLAGEGVPALVRAVEAELMAESDLLGVPSHGVRMLPLLVAGLREGRATADPRLQIMRDEAATCVLEGDRGPGRYISVQAVRMALERAARFGLGACLAVNVAHWGRAHAYAYRMAQAGMIGLCTTNAIPNMVAWDSPRPVLGNNPLAIGVPRGPGREPVVLDMAMSQAALGKLGTYAREGKPAPPGWGLDAQGRPTSDPQAILASGNVLPVGEHKGAGLALMMELLTGALSGGLLSQEVVLRDSSGLDPYGSKFFLAIDIARFIPLEQFFERVDTLLTLVAAGVGPEKMFFYPGQRGWETRDRYLAEGIPLHPQIIAQLETLGMTLP